MIPAARMLAAEPKPHIAVIGAGAFGGWTAVYLQRLGARVTLLDAWGPGNSRASSGGETRVIRATYADRPYVDLVVRALELWQENERRWDRKMFFQTGVIWMTGEKQQLERAALGYMQQAGVSVEALTGAEAAKLFPQINFENIRLVLREKNAGFLTARRNCEYVLENFRKEGGEYRQLAVEPGSIESGKMQALKLSDGSELTADAYAFCCGPWLGKVFPALLGDMIHPTRQEVFFFGSAPGDARYLETQMPTWIDNTKRFSTAFPETSGAASKSRATHVALHLTPPKASACRLPKVLSTPGSIWNSDSPECGERRCSKPAFASTKTRRISISCSTAILKRRMSGWPAAARDTGTNTGRQWAKDWRA